MDEARRVRALRVVQKLRDQHVEKAGAELGQLRAHRSEVERLSETIQNQSLEALRQRADTHLPFTAQFLAEATRLQKSLAHEIEKLRGQEEEFKLALAEAFVEAKANESVLGASLKRIEDEALRLENNELSDLVAVRHYQKKQKSSF